MEDVSPSHLGESGITIPSDSENYDANNEMSSSPPSSSSTPLILYKPPTLWGLVRGAAINLVLPFVNGLMLGFGELVANEVAFRLGWSGTKVRRHPGSSYFCHIWKKGAHDKLLSNKKANNLLRSSPHTAVNQDV
jgi:hypothetical protein